MLYCYYNRIYGYSQVPFPGTRKGRIGNGVKVSDRTAAVRRSDGRRIIGREAEKIVRSDEAESEDLPAQDTYRTLRTKAPHVP